MTGIPASGRRNYSQWELGQELQALDTEDAGRLEYMQQTPEEDVDMQPSDGLSVYVRGSSHEESALSHITVGTSW